MPSHPVIVFIWLTLSHTILFYSTSGIFPGAKDLTSDLSHSKYVPQKTACYGDWAACFHWKFQVDTAKFFPRKLAFKLSLKRVVFDKYTLSNKMENSMLIPYLQRCWFKCTLPEWTVVVPSTLRKWEEKNPNPTSEIKRKVKCEPIIHNMPRTL